MLELFDRIRAMISNRESAEALREHLDLFKSKVESLQASEAALQQALAQAQAKAERLEVELAAKTRAEEFCQVEDMLFRRPGDGRKPDLPPYCPNCRTAMSFLLHDFGYKCPACKFISHVEAQHVKGLLAAYKG